MAVIKLKLHFLHPYYTFKTSVKLYRFRCENVGKFYREYVNAIIMMVLVSSYGLLILS